MTETQALSPEQVEKLQNQALESRKTLAITNALAPMNFIDPEEARILSEKSIHLDATTGAFYGIDDYGKRLSLPEFFRSFANRKPYLVNHAATQKAVAETTKTGLKTPKAKSDFITRFGFDAWLQLPSR